MSATYVEPKISWAGSQAPLPSDMNRIEGNTKANHEAVLNEAAARHNDDVVEANARQSADAAEANARHNDVVAEANARQSADNSVLSGHPFFFIENRTSDPSSALIGHLWLRVDL